MCLPEAENYGGILHDEICKYSLGGSCVDGNQLSEALRKIAFYCLDENLS